MKIRINIDCTPEEARAFLGMPDVKPMQDSLMAEMTERMTKNLEAMDAETLIKTWLPAGLEGWQQMQKIFWSHVAGAGQEGQEEKK